MELLMGRSRKKRHDDHIVRKIDQDLFNAAYFGDEQKVMKFIREGGNVNYMEERDGWLGIHYAARWGNNKMILAYLHGGADVDGRTKNKETALHKAARWDCKETAILLLNHGANPLLKSSDGNKPSEMTSDPEIKFLLDNFEEYKNIQASRGVNITVHSKKKVIQSPIGQYIKGKAGVSNGKISNLLSPAGNSFFDTMPKTPTAINWDTAQSASNSPQQGGMQQSPRNGYNGQQSPQNTYQQQAPNMYQNQNNGFQQSPNMYQNQNNRFQQSPY